MDQETVIEFLETGAPFGVKAADIERMDTHISAIFLVGEEAYKLKRARKYPYLDFSTLEKRKAACDAEIRINRRTAPDIYRGIVAVTDEGGGRLALDGEGEPVDWLVRMRRFDNDTLFDRLAERGELDARCIEELADEIADFHAEAAVEKTDRGASRLAKVIDGVAESFASIPLEILDPARTRVLVAKCREKLEEVAALLDARAEAGKIRHCHGDLHLRNICLWQGRPTLFDAIEFDEEIATTDLLYDLGFLLMDLEHRGLRELANRCLNRYMERTADYDGLAALGLFMAVRASVRAHITATIAKDAENDDKRAAKAAEAEAYTELAEAFLTGGAPQLFAIGGLSGTGKTTVARLLAPELPPAPGAILLRSDVTRKQLAGVKTTDRLPQTAYAPEMTERVYAALIARARRCLAAGHSAIVDAVSGRPDERDAIEDVARETAVPFAGIWLEAPLGELERRVEARTGDASDADAEIVRRQAEYDLGAIRWTRVNARGTPSAVLERVRRVPPRPA